MDYQQRELPRELKDQLAKAIEPYSPRLGSFRFNNERNYKFEGFDYPGFVQNFSSAAEAITKRSSMLTSGVGR